MYKMFINGIYIGNAQRKSYGNDWEALSLSGFYKSGLKNKGAAKRWLIEQYQKYLLKEAA